MPQPPNDPVLMYFAGGALLLSILTGLSVLAARGRRPILPYEPRRPVPWNAGATLLVVIMLANTLASLALRAPDDRESKASSEMRAELLATQAVSQLVVVGAALLAIAYLSRATRRDLGLPANAAVAGRDVGIGIVAGLASLAPVIVVQVGLTYLIYPGQKESGHPLIKLVTAGPPSELVLILMAVIAVIVAPICEEISFRLLLQGWLEKWEDARLGWREEAAALLLTTDEAATANGEADQTEITPLAVDAVPFEPTPPPFSIAGLPYGWFPIIVSAILFGLAHVGYGPEPVPLFLLGLVLGYVYQRTHRILPGIIIHALFNLFSVIALWRMVLHQG